MDPPLTAFVVDIGSLSVRCGYAGDDTPRQLHASCVGIRFPRSSHSHHHRQTPSLSDLSTAPTATATTRQSTNCSGPGCLSSSSPSSCHVSNGISFSFSSANKISQPYTTTSSSLCPFSCSSDDAGVLLFPLTFSSKRRHLGVQSCLYPTFASCGGGASPHSSSSSPFSSWGGGRGKSSAMTALSGSTSPSQQPSYILHEDVFEALLSHCIEGSVARLSCSGGRGGGLLYSHNSTTSSRSIAGAGGGGAEDSDDDDENGTNTNAANYCPVHSASTSTCNKGSFNKHSNNISSSFITSKASHMLSPSQATSSTDGLSSCANHFSSAAAARSSSCSCSSCCSSLGVVGVSSAAVSNRLTNSTTTATTTTPATTASTTTTAAAAAAMVTTNGRETAETATDALDQRCTCHNRKRRLKNADSRCSGNTFCFSSSAFAPEIREWLPTEMCGLGESLCDYPLMLSEPNVHCRELREKMVEIAFEKLSSPAVYVAPRAQLSCLSLGRSSGMVIDIGAAAISIAPVVDGFVLHQEVGEWPAGGNFLDQLLACALRRHRLPLLPLFSSHKKYLTSSLFGYGGYGGSSDIYRGYYHNTGMCNFTAGGGGGGGLGGRSSSTTSTASKRHRNYYDWTDVHTTYLQRSQCAALRALKEGFIHVAPGLQGTGGIRTREDSSSSSSSSFGGGGGGGSSSSSSGRTGGGGGGHAADIHHTRGGSGSGGGGGLLSQQPIGPLIFPSVTATVSAKQQKDNNTSHHHPITSRYIAILPPPPILPQQRTTHHTSTSRDRSSSSSSASATSAHNVNNRTLELPDGTILAAEELATAIPEVLFRPQDMLQHLQQEEPWLQGAAVSSFRGIGLALREVAARIESLEARREVLNGIILTGGCSAMPGYHPLHFLSFAAALMPFLWLLTNYNGCQDYTND